uniref:Putative protease n=1 Tax=viral metagenome TaxID=1070528 RepID=A0A6M3KUV2_9ZZZZ
MSLSKKTREYKSSIVGELHEYNILLETKEIFLHGYIGDTEDDPGIDYRSASNFIKNIKILESMDDKPIIVHQYSVGGSWECGMMMFDIINNSNLFIIFILHGVAASMGSIIPQAADLRVIMPNCCFMVHSGYTGINSELTMKQSRSWIEWERHITDSTFNIYAEKCQNGLFFTEKQSTISDVKKYIKKQLDEREDWFLGSCEAVNLGFADGIYGQSGFEDINIIRKLCEK